MLLPDPDGSVHGDLDAGRWSRALCDRRAGHRRRRRAPGGPHRRRTTTRRRSRRAARPSGSWTTATPTARVSEMCGNGVRVFARYLADHEGVDPRRPLPVGTRAGVKVLTFDADGLVTRRHGRRPTCSARPRCRSGDRSWPALHVSMGNPHAVAFVDDLADAGPAARRARRTTRASTPTASTSSSWYAAGERHVAMRVHERGLGGDPVLRHRRLRRDGRRRPAPTAPAPRHDVPGRRARRPARRDLDRGGPGAARPARPSWSPREVRRVRSVVNHVDRVGDPCGILEAARESLRVHRRSHWWI